MTESQLKNKYGITRVEYLQILLDQDCKCAICGDELIAGKSTHLDHSHALEGKRSVRNLLCVRCNVLLGMCKENKEILKSAMSYLERHWTAYHDDVQAADAALEEALY